MFWLLSKSLGLINLPVAWSLLIWLNDAPLLEEW